MSRPYRGSRVASFYPVKSLPPLASLDSAFQLQEYISLLIRLDVHDVDAIVALPGKPADDALDAPDPDPKRPDDPDRKCDVSVDRACWIYEQLRRLAQDLSHPLITMLQQECTRSSCPQMKAGEWLYLCVAHGNDGAMEQCCAIDYILHTVDSATALLNSPRAFPSRLSIPQTSHRHFSSLARRLGRIFAHAYFHHREAFEQAEAESSLYARFLKLTDQFDLVPREFLVIPESAIHRDDKSLDDQAEPPRLFSAAIQPAQILQNHPFSSGAVADVDQFSNSRQRSVDVANQLGTDSPRRLGRSRTDTMVFSEAYNMAEELSRGDETDTSHSDSLLDISPVPETETLASMQFRPNLEARTDDLDDEDVGDAHSESTLAGPLSPPVEELSLISLEDTSGAAVSHEDALDHVPSESLPQGPLSDEAPTIESGSQDSIEVIDVPEENAPAGEHSTSEVAESSPEKADATSSEVLTESTDIPPGPEQSVSESVNEDEPMPVSSAKEPVDAEPHAASVLAPQNAPPPEPLLELNEPPPSEPIPPESESDITDEVGGHDGDEVREGGEVEAVVGE